MGNIQQYRDAYLAAIQAGRDTYEARKKAEQDAKDALAAVRAEAAQLEKEENGRLLELYRMAFGPAGVITQDVVDVLAPEHQRTSCSDADLSNEGRCNRCDLMLALQDPEYYLRERRFRITIERLGAR